MSSLADSRLRTAKLWLAASLGLLVTACQGAVLNPAGDVAREQRNLIYISTGLMLLIIVPVMILIVVFAWRYRKGKGGTYDPDFDHSTSLELLIWSAPLMIIIALGALTWSSTHLLDPFRPRDKTASLRSNIPVEKPLVVQVVSLDWKWLFIYPEQGVATVNDLVLPVGRQVRFDLTSSNMMNTFFNDTATTEIYTMPGMQSSLHAKLDRPVDSFGMSANYSGAGFSDMRFRIRGVSNQQFEAWIGGAQGGSRLLDLATYRQLVKPSEKVPPMLFRRVDDDLFRRIVERCVEPGTSCMSEMMHGGGGHGSMPRMGPKAEGALQKAPEDKGTGKNVTAPADPDAAPGPSKPNSPANRNMTLGNPPAHLRHPAAVRA